MRCRGNEDVMLWGKTIMIWNDINAMEEILRKIYHGKLVVGQIVAGIVCLCGVISSTTVPILKTISPILSIGVIIFKIYTITDC